MNILVAGGAGYLGSCVVEELIDLNQTPWVIDDLLYTPTYQNYKVSFIRGDISHSAWVHEAIRRSEPDCIIWLAAIVGDAACAIDPIRSYRVNAEAVKVVANEYSGKLIFPSTCSVYGISPEPVGEDAPFNPQSIYAETKIRAEENLKGRPDTFIFRLGTLHGVSQRMRFDLAINKMSLDAAELGIVNLFGGQQRRPFAQVSEVAYFFCGVALGASQPGTYNLASENLTLLETATKVSKATGARINLKEMPYEDRRDYSVLCGKLESAFKVDFLYDVEISSKSIYDVVLSGRLRNPHEPQYYNAIALGGKNG